jgi:hypothetical protein
LKNDTDISINTEGRRFVVLRKKNFSNRAAKHNEWSPIMQTSRLISIVDRFALTLMNAMVFVGLPLAAAGLFIR